MGKILATVVALFIACMVCGEACAAQITPRTSVVCDENHGLIVVTNEGYETGEYFIVKSDLKADLEVLGYKIAKRSYDDVPNTICASHVAVINDGPTKLWVSCGDVKEDYDEEAYSSMLQRCSG